MTTDIQPGAPAAPATPQTPRKSHVSTIIICLLLAIIAGGIAAFWLYLRNEREAEAEERAYKVLDSSTESADYADFLERFPKSGYRTDVQTRMRKLQAMERDWGYIQNSSNPSDFVRFKNKYTSAYYDRLCDAKIDSLDWITAQQQGSGAAVNRYMQLHPDGKFFADATVAHQQLTANEPTAAETESVMAVMNQFFRDFGDNNTEGISQLIPNVMSRFLSKTGISREDVIGTISKMFNEHILGCDFHVGSDFRITKRMEEGVPVFTVNASVDQRIERDNEGKSSGRYTIRAEVDGNGKVRALTMNPKD